MDRWIGLFVTGSLVGSTMILLTLAPACMATEGEAVWFNTYHGDDWPHRNLVAAVDPSGSLVMSGFLEDPAEAADRWVVRKVASDGTSPWTMDLTPARVSDDQAITTDPDGNIYVAATIWQYGIGERAFLHKISPDGTLQWTQEFETDEMLIIHRLHYRDDGYVIVTGRTGECWGAAALYPDSGQIWWDAEVVSIDGYETGSVRFSGLDSEGRITLAGTVRIDGTSFIIGWQRLLPNGVADVSGVNETVNGFSMFDGAGALAQDGRLYLYGSEENTGNGALFAVNSEGAIDWQQPQDALYTANNTGALLLYSSNPVLAYQNLDGYTITVKRLAASSGQLISSQVSEATGSRVLQNNMTLDAGGNAYLTVTPENDDQEFSLIKMSPQAGQEWQLDFGFAEGDVIGSGTNTPAYLGFHNGGIVGASLFDPNYVEDFNFVAYRVVEVASGVTGELTPAMPHSLTLAVAPNPFNPTTTVRVSLPEPGRLFVSLYDMMGRQVAVFSDRAVAPGTHLFQLNGANLSSGVYLLHAETNAGQVSQRVTLLK